VFLHKFYIKNPATPLVGVSLLSVVSRCKSIETVRHLEAKALYMLGKCF